MSFSVIRAPDAASPQPASVAGGLMGSENKILADLQPNKSAAAYNKAWQDFKEHKRTDPTRPTSWGTLTFSIKRSPSTAALSSQLTPI
jgi:hypothetical protein